MDFLRILKSFEEFVYEALIWLLLLPWTLARIVVHPRRMTAYAARELADEGEGRFDQAVSPPLLLILCVLLSHFADLLIRAQTARAASAPLASAVLASEQNLLLYRTVAFGVWALAGSVCFMWLAGNPLGRRGLRMPFYEQCYLVAPFALAVSVGTSLILMGEPAEAGGVAIALAGAAWFWAVQIAWIRGHTGLPLWRSVLAASLVLCAGALVNAAVGAALSH